MTELLVLSLAAAITWELTRYFIPADIPARLAPVVIILEAFTLDLILVHKAWFSHPFIYALAATAGVAIFNRITDASERTPEVLSLRRPRAARRDRIPQSSHRIPG